jgi:hypothetical protein
MATNGMGALDTAVLQAMLSPALTGEQAARIYICMWFLQSREEAIQQNSAAFEAGRTNRFDLGKRGGYTEHEVITIAGHGERCS